MNLDDELALQSRIDELQQALLRSQQATAKAKAKTEELVAAIYQAAKDAAIAHPPKPVKPARDTRKKKPEVALIHATDWQLGKQTVSYDMDTCRKRIERFTDKVLQITEIQRQDHPVREAVLMLGGDMVEGGGNIFPSQVHEIEAYLFEQIFATVEIAEHMIRRLAGDFKLKVVCEWGNHGRLGRYGDTTHAGDNADRIIYRMLEDRTKHMGIEWQASMDWYQHFMIGNYSVLLVHGDEIKSFSGTPLFAIIKRVSAWAAGIIPGWNGDCYMGHWHNPASMTIGNGNRVYITGSPESGNIYAQEHLAAQSKPSQRLHFIDPEAGRVTSEWLVWLD